jgi:replicative DNA helicase
MSAPVAPPVDHRAEEIVAGELVAFPKAVGILAERGLKPDDLYMPKNRVVYEAALKVMQGGGEANEVSIWGAIEALGHAAPNGAGIVRNEIESRTKGHGIYFGVGDIAERLMELADRHRKFSAAHKILGAVGLEQPDEYNAAIQAALEELAADHEVEAQPTTPEEIAMFLHDFLESEAPATAWPLPWPRLNRGLPGGLLPGQTSVWMGWTNMGKSAAIDEAVAYWHARGARCGLIGTEMSLLERGARTLQTQTGISSLRFLSKQLTRDEEAALSKAIQPQNMPFAFHDAQGWSYHRIAQLITLKRYDIAVK